jgi:[ribosomal protein S5]-alanine N-acetyltransferase
MINETERIVLREPDESDVERLRAYHRRNAARFALWDAVPADEPEAHLAWIRGHRAARKAGRPIAFLGFDRSTSELVGLVALTGFGAEPPSAMINYSLDEAYEGKGYAFEMTAQMVRYAFEELQLTSITASVRVGNARSLRLLERLGFVIVARSPEIPGLGQLFHPHVIAVLERSRAAILRAEQ